MARIRTIKPEFFTSEDIIELSPLARLLYIALWCEADREGRFEWKPKTFKIRYLPMDECSIDALCQELLDRKLVVLYHSESGQALAFVPAFREHQNINPREANSTLPEPKLTTRQPRVNHASTTREQRDSDAPNIVGRERKGKERKGRERVSNNSKLSDKTDHSPPDHSSQPPTLEEVKAYAMERFNLNGTFADQFFSKNAMNGWIHQSSGEPIKNWKNLMANWVSRLGEIEKDRYTPKAIEKNLSVDEIGREHGWRDDE